MTKPWVWRIWRLAVAAEVVLVGLDLAVRLPGLGLGEADGGDLGVAVGDPRDRRLDDRRGSQPGDLLGDEDALLEAAVRELEPGHDVADGIHALDAGPQALVGRDEAAVERHAGLLVPEAVGDGAAADGDEQQVGLDGRAVLERDRDDVARLGGAGELARPS